MLVWNMPKPIAFAEFNHLKGYKLIDQLCDRLTLEKQKEFRPKLYKAICKPIWRFYQLSAKQMGGKRAFDVA